MRRAGSIVVLLAVWAAVGSCAVFRKTPIAFESDRPARSFPFIAEAARQLGREANLQPDHVAVILDADVWLKYQVELDGELVFWVVVEGRVPELDRETRFSEGQAEGQRIWTRALELMRGAGEGG